MPIPKPYKNESKEDFINRCMSDEKMKSEYDQEQRYAVCSTQLSKPKVSFDFDGTLNTRKGYDLAKSLIADNTVYIISARHDKIEMLRIAKKLNIPYSRVYATGDNTKKIKKIKQLGITTHYDNNKDVIRELGKIGKQI